MTKQFGFIPYLTKKEYEELSKNFVFEDSFGTIEDILKFDDYIDYKKHYREHQNEIIKCVNNLNKILTDAEMKELEGNDQYEMLINYLSNEELIDKVKIAHKIMVNKVIDEIITFKDIMKTSYFKKTYKKWIHGQFENWSVFGLYWKPVSIEELGCSNSEPLLYYLMENINKKDLNKDFVKLCKDNNYDVMEAVECIIFQNCECMPEKMQDAYYEFNNNYEQ